MLAEAEKTDWGKYNYISDTKLEEKVIAALIKASEVIKKDLDAIYKNYGLTFSQYNVLRILNNCKDGQNTVTVASKIMLVSSPNMTGVAKRLEKNGFILRKRDPKDERVTLLEITPKGRRVLKNIQKSHHSNIRSYLKIFSDDENERLLEDLKRLLKEASSA